MRRPRLSLVTRRLVLLAGLTGSLLIGGLIGGLWLYCHGQRSKEVVLPPPTGPYRVGRTAFVWTDTTRMETFAPAQDKKKKRELVVWVWYPAAATSAARPADYLPPNWRQAREQVWGGGKFLMQDPASIRCHALADAPLSPTQSAYPVLIMEPGLGPIAPDYTTLAEDLASHGYVVVGVTPTYSASVVAFPDGHIAPASPQGSIPDEGLSITEERRLLDNLIAVWTSDAVFTINQVAKLNGDAKAVFYHRLDLSRLGVFGHSFGGSTALQVCRIDPRCKAAVDLDGYPYGKVTPDHLAQPVMFMWSEPDDINEAHYVQARQEVETIFGGLQHGGYQITIGGAHHFNFTDMAVEFVPILRRTGLLGPINGQRGLTITCAYTRAFFDQALNHQDAPLFDLHKGASATYPEAKIIARP
jgi:predicted dienelactone hydrolase